MVKKQTPLTVEVFQDVLMPQINKKFEEFRTEIAEKINHLPTREEYFAREDKTMGELQKLREEVAITGHHYEKTNKRVDIIDKHLGIDTSVVF